jgi:hypothetical protein
LLLFVSGGDALEQHAFFWLARDDGVVTRVGLSEGLAAEVVAETAVLFIWPVALEAIGLEDGLDVASEVWRGGVNG